MSNLLRHCAISTTAVAVLILAGCSQSTTPNPAASTQPAATTQSEAPPEIVAAKTAFWPMYTAARNWAPDIVVLRITAKEVPGFKNEGGKAAMWEAAFASPSRHEYRVDSYSIATVPPYTHKGVMTGLRMPWGGATRTVMPVDLSMFNVDSDDAYKAAAGDAADWLKKNPDKGLATLEIGATYKTPGPAWFFMWGTKKSGYTALVDASGGKVLKHI
jgi:hypothetical protein